MRGKLMTQGLEKAPHRSLLSALGLTREEMDRPLIGVVNAANETIREIQLSPDVFAAPPNPHLVYEAVKHDICLSSISGGTDIVSCFALGNPTLPVWRGELQCRGPALGAPVQREDVLLAEREAHALAEVGGGLLRGEKLSSHSIKLRDIHPRITSAALFHQR